jgi:hypothetical protein
VRDLAIFLFGDLRDGNAEAEQASVHGIESLGDRRVVKKVAVKDCAQLGISAAKGPAHDGANFLHYRRRKTSGENRAARGT